MKLSNTSTLFAFLILNIICAPGWAENPSSRIEDMDIDYRIRASEDPHFDQYLAELKQKQVLEKRTAKESKEQKLRVKSEYLAAQKVFAKKHKLEREKEAKQRLAARKAYYQKQKTINLAERKTQKRFGQEQVQKRNLEIQKQQRLIARMHTRLTRLPASSQVRSRKRIPQEKRQELYRRVLADKKLILDLRR